MEKVDHTQIRRERTVARAPRNPRERTLARVSGTPRERPLASPKRTIEPRKGDTYDVLLDYDSDTYEYRRKRRDGYKPVKFVYAGKSTEQRSDEEVQRDWELMMAERRRLASVDGRLRVNARPRFAGLGSIKELEPFYREAASSANDEAPSELHARVESLQLV